MCTVVEICSTGVRVTLSDVPEVLLTATNSELPVQDAGLAAMAGYVGRLCSVQHCGALRHTTTSVAPVGGSLEGDTTCF